MTAPKFNTAIPKKRFQIGEYSAVLLGDIDSGDEQNYIYVVGFVVDGQAKPTLYITFERNSDPDISAPYFLRAITNDSEQIMGYSEQKMDIDQFSKGALHSGAEALGLADEEIHQIM